MAKLEDDPKSSRIPPWEMPGAIRRDSEPHRAELLMRLADVSATFGYLSIGFYVIAVSFSSLTILLYFFVVLFVVIAQALGSLTYLLSRHDLALMELGLMDRAGEEATESARRNSATAMKFGVLGAIIAVGPVLFAYWSLRV